MGRQNFKGSNRGLTLIEVLVIIAILSLLTIVLFMTVNPLKQLAKAKDSQKETDLQKISKALEDYLNDNPCYPEAAVFSSCGSSVFSPYLKTVPCDPETKLPYYYERPECQKFAIYATLRTKNQTITYGGKGNYVVTSPNYRLTAGEVEVLSPIPQPTVSGLYYGCFSGICRQIEGFLCKPNYLSSECYGQCGSPASPRNECQ